MLAGLRKNGWKIIAVVSLLFVGYLFGAISSSPSFAAKKFQYKVVRVPDTELQALLNEMGSGGWEYVSLIDVFMVFKR